MVAATSSGASLERISLAHPRLLVGLDGERGHRLAHAGRQALPEPVVLLLRHVEGQQTLLEPAGAAAGVGGVARHQYRDVALAQAQHTLHRLRLRLARHELAARLARVGAVQAALLRVGVVLGAAADAARDVMKTAVLITILALV